MSRPMVFSLTRGGAAIFAGMSAPRNQGSVMVAKRLGGRVSSLQNSWHNSWLGVGSRPSSEDGHFCEPSREFAGQVAALVMQFRPPGVDDLVAPGREENDRRF